MIDIYFKTIKDRLFKKIESDRVGTWINIEDATTEDLAKVSALTRLDVADFHDSLDSYEIPRIERQEGNTILFVRSPDPDDTENFTELLTIIISEKYIITISASKNKIISRLLDQKLTVATTQKSKLLIQILLRIYQSYNLEIKNVRNIVLKSRSAAKKVRNADLIEFAESEDVLNQYISALVPMNNVLEAVRGGKFINLYEEDEDILQDLLIAGKQAVDICVVNIKSIKSLRDSYQAVFSNNLNKIIKLFTALTIILEIPMIMTGLFGMNVPLPFQSNVFGFIYVVMITVTISLTILIIFWIKKWL
ncbi:MAG: magnesium transporter CorA family protein [Candidatus Levybacteria bacterium]|nr:magnesium transporter CorA family protein [Candidatus Levybacteria bacterium]